MGRPVAAALHGANRLSAGPIAVLPLASRSPVWMELNAGAPASTCVACLSPNRRVDRCSSERRDRHVGSGVVGWDDDEVRVCTLELV